MGVLYGQLQALLAIDADAGAVQRCQNFLTIAADGGELAALVADPERTAYKRSYVLDIVFSDHIQKRHSVCFPHRGKPEET